MGYSYGPRGLCCDSCGQSGNGTRRRPCPHKVTYPQDGPGRSLPYCPAPALCPECLKREGGTRAIHARCAEPAAAASRKNAEIATKVASGDPQVMSAYGSWHEHVPEGWVGVMFAPNRTDRWREQTHKLVPSAAYADRPDDAFLSDFPDAIDWPEGASA